MNYLEPYGSIFFKTNKNGLWGWVRRILLIWKTLLASLTIELLQFMQQSEDMEMMEHCYQQLALLWVVHLSRFHKEQIC
jgi:hypothetical protein